MKTKIKKLRSLWILLGVIPAATLVEMGAWWWILVGIQLSAMILLIISFKLEK